MVLKTVFNGKAARPLPLSSMSDFGGIAWASLSMRN